MVERNCYMLLVIFQKPIGKCCFFEICQLPNLENTFALKYVHILDFI